MYLAYFGLQQKPFLITPDPRFLYPSAGHQEALAHLRYGLEREGGFLLLTGEVGTGKTTLCRLFMDDLPGHFRLAYLLNTKLDSVGVLAGICRELDIAGAGDCDANTLVERIYDNLLQTHSAGQRTLVVIEEAQNLSADVLETLRLLTNLETSATKLLHILLIGQPELLETLRQPGLRQLNQRVVSRSHLGALQRHELRPYFRHRLEMAGTRRPLFSDGALAIIYRHTGGIPRLLNLLAEHCLMGAYAQDQSQVTRKIARRAAVELSATLQQPAPAPPAGGLRRPRAFAAGVFGVLAVSAALWLWQSGTVDGLFPAALPPTAVEASLPIQAAGPEPLKRAVEHSDGELGEAVPATVAESRAQAMKPAPETASPPRASADALEPRANAYQRLLAAWDVTASAGNEDQLCEAAARHDLLCARSRLDSARQLLSLPGPAVVKVHNRLDSIDIYLLKAEAGELTLANSVEDRRVTIRDLEDVLVPEVVALWRPPLGYSEPLTAGEHNPPLVERLVAWLGAAGYLPDNLVAGGVYSDYLASRVKAFQRDHNLAVDGILGQQTLLLLQQYGPDRGDGGALDRRAVLESSSGPEAAGATGEN